MFFSFCARARGAAGIVHGRGEKWICIGAIYWLDGRRGARRVGRDRGYNTCAARGDGRSERPRMKFIC